MWYPNPQCCLMRLYQSYLQQRQKQCDDTFYFTSLKNKQKMNSKVLIDHNTLSKTVSHLCSNAGITGFKTNHSPRVTTVSWLFQSGAEEQIIMSHTGHRSTDGVRTYKHENTQQKRSLSEGLNAASNGQLVSYNVEVRKRPKMDVGESSLSRSSSYTIQNTSTQRSVAAMTTATTFNFTGCSSITIHYLTD